MKRKQTIFLLLFAITVFMGTINVYAVGSTVDCGIFRAEFVTFLSDIYGYIKIIAPIAWILMGMIDFGKVVILNPDEKDKGNKDYTVWQMAIKRFVKRGLLVLAVFFLPVILNMVFRLPGLSGIIGSSDPLCGVR